MSILVDIVERAAFVDGFIVISMTSGEEIRFPVSANPRLARGNASELNHIEISPLGLHWPDLDEDLSIRGILEKKYA